jgi:hypothetical protein
MAGLDWALATRTPGGMFEVFFNYFEKAVADMAVSSLKQTVLSQECHPKVSSMNFPVFDGLCLGI